MATTAIFTPSPCRPATPRPVSDRLLRYLRRAMTRRALAGLTPAQRDDMGIDPAGPGERPVLEIDARTMVGLMSLR